MRRLLIGSLLPVLLCILPFLAAGLVLLCIPPSALKYFADQIDLAERRGMMEVLIIGGGVMLFLTQMVLAFSSLRWRGTGFNEASDRWLMNLAQSAEWFPMLGLIGTVVGILEAFASVKAGSTIQPRLIAPAITATGAGLFMALVNMLPSWIVLLGRDLILMLSGTTPQPREEES